MRIARSIFLLGTLSTTLQFALNAQEATRPSPTTTNIGGVILDDAREPVASAEVALTQDRRVVGSMRSENDGRFTFANVAARPGSITVRRLGFRQQTIPVDIIAATAGKPLEISLETLASPVEPVIIDAAGGRMAEFAAHRQNSSFGHFFDQRDIQRLAPRHTSELFRTIPGAQVQVASGIGNRVLLRGCRPRVWVNGVRTVNAEVDEVAAPSEIDGLEIYPSIAGTPAQYMDRENRACGTVVVWTRR
jgi:Carboxypeptidase regulatory-like domain